MSYEQLMRLINYDDSGEFKIIININEEQINDGNIQVSGETNIVINTTINKARVISNIINELYISDQTINHYEIKLDNIQEDNKTRKIVEVFKLLLKSIGKEVRISEELGYIYFIIEYHLNGNLDEQKSNSIINDNNNNDNNNNDNNNNDNNNNYNNNINDNNNNDDDDETRELGYSDLLFMYQLFNKNK